MAETDDALRHELSIIRSERSADIRALNERVIELDHKINQTYSASEQSARDYMREHITALREIKDHDLISVNLRIDDVDRRLMTTANHASREYVGEAVTNLKELYTNEFIAVNRRIDESERKISETVGATGSYASRSYVGEQVTSLRELNVQEFVSINRRIDEFDRRANQTIGAVEQLKTNTTNYATVEYTRELYVSLKELKAHDLAAIHARIDEFDRRVSQTFVSVEQLKTNTTNYATVEYTRELYVSLKELKAHDLAAINARIDGLTARLIDNVAGIERVIEQSNTAWSDRHALFKTSLDERFQTYKSMMEHTVDLDRDAHHRECEAIKQNIAVLASTSSSGIETAFKAAKEAIMQTDIGMTNRFIAVDQRFASAKELSDKIAAAAADQVSAAMVASKEAVAKSEAATEKRFEGVNEFRAALTDSTSRMMTRTEVTASLSSLNDKVVDLSSRIDRMQGAGQGTDKSLTTLFSIGGLVIAVLVGIVSFASYQRGGSNAANSNDANITHELELNRDMLRQNTEILNQHTDQLNHKPN